MNVELVDSAKTLLEPPQIMMQYAQGETDEYPLHAVLAGIAQELSMPRAEAIQFGNTIFINHYTGDDDKDDEDDEDGVFMRMMNVDTPENLVDNIENYVVYAYSRGIESLFVLYDDSAITSAIKAVSRRVNKNNPHVNFKVTFEPYEGQQAAVCSLSVKGR
jgi:hypothetical protein